MVIAAGSYPAGRWFESDRRYQTWLLGQAVKTSPFHGGNTSSILVGVTNGELAQLGEHLPYKQGVTGSSPVLPTKRHIRAHLAPFLHVSRSVIYAQ